MQTHGYRLAHNAGSAPTDYIPSLIGIDEQQVTPERHDIYFESFAPIEVSIHSIAISRWVTYDSQDPAGRDPILGLKTDKGSFYIPLSELREEANAVADGDVLLMLASLRGGTLQ